MAYFLRHRCTIHVPSFGRLYNYRNDPNAGFSFDCDKGGNIKPIPSPEGQANYQKCIDGTYDVGDAGVIDYSYGYQEAAAIRCECGAVVSLDSGIANTCERCGREYNMSGDLLAPRQFWGEETNECLADIMSTYDPEAVIQESDIGGY